MKNHLKWLLPVIVLAGLGAWYVLQQPAPDPEQPPAIAQTSSSSASSIQHPIAPPAEEPTLPRLDDSDAEVPDGASSS